MSIWIKSWYKFFVDWRLLILKIKLISPNGKKLIKIFFSETINMIAPKLYINGYWKALYKVGIFYICLVSRMDTTAWLSFKHMGKLIKAFFLNYRLSPKCTWLVIGWSLWKLSFFKWIGNSWWLPLHANQFFLAHLAFRPCELLPSPFVCPSTFHILIFSSETTGPIATKLWWNGPWMALFQNYVRWSRLPTKMATKLKIEKRGDEILI